MYVRRLEPTNISVFLAVDVYMMSICCLYAVSMLFSTLHETLVVYDGLHMLLYMLLFQKCMTL
jgi:hypothetical protein